MPHHHDDGDDEQPAGQVAIRLRCTLDGRPVQTSTTWRAAGPDAVVITTVMPDPLAVRLTSTYTGADQLGTAIAHLLTGRDLAALEQHAVDVGELPLVADRRRLLLDHAARWQQLLAEHGHATVDVDDHALDRTST